MPHVPFTLDQLAVVQAFPVSHRLALRSRVVLDPEEVEEVAELYTRAPYDPAYTLAAAPGGTVEAMVWPHGEWHPFATLHDALAWVIEREGKLERTALQREITSL